MLKTLFLEEKYIQRHIQQLIKATTLLSQETALLKASLKTSQAHRSTAKAPKNRKSLLRTKGNDNISMKLQWRQEIVIVEIGI
ncbi:hypothetical protein N7465_008888 [Penicillium sp. CMV-2018d]|nr:hypothetical protein N7465_008888 [Penicillium sp. CMV-2018d]